MLYAGLYDFSHDFIKREYFAQNVLNTDKSWLFV